MAMCVAVFVPLLCLHRSLRSVVSVALVVNWPVGAELAPWRLISVISTGRTACRIDVANWIGIGVYTWLVCSYIVTSDRGAVGQ